MSLVRHCRRLARKCLCIALHYSGATRIGARWLLRDKAVVLTYHRVLPDGADSFTSRAIVVSPATFQRHMQLVRSLLNPVTAESLDAMLSGRQPWIPRACLVTFDDGWHDNVTHALPILRRAGVPALVFVATQYIGAPRTFWQEWMSRLLHAAWTAGEAGTTLLASAGAARIAGCDATRVKAGIRSVIDELKPLPPERIDAIIQSLEHSLREAGCLPDTPGDDYFADWAALVGVGTGGVMSIGSHAHTHTPLTKLSLADASTELRTAEQVLTRHGVRWLPYFAYPNGDFTPAVADTIRSHGLQMGFTTQGGWVQAGDDAMTLRRLNISDVDTASNSELACRILLWA